MVALVPGGVIEYAFQSYLSPFIEWYADLFGSFLDVWACKIVTGVPAAVPFVGPPIVLLLRGGESVGQGTLTRFYSAHTFVLPLAAAVLMLTHFLMIRKQGISGPL